MTHTYDVAVIGGGINGCGCAAEASSRGLSVVLIEQDDLASKTSSKSTKLIHGGLRYLEYFDFSLVKKALNERQTLMQVAPHLVKPQAFLLPFKKHGRSLLTLKIGLFIYDHLNLKNQLPKSELLTRQHFVEYFEPLVPKINKGFIFYDCLTDDSRLTITNALQAKAYGANILSYTKLIHATSIDNLWHLTIRSKHNITEEIKARAIINAGGPWVEDINKLLSVPTVHKIQLVKGSHILVPKLYEGNHGYMLQNTDDRIIFVIPYFNRTLIGTTEKIYQNSLEQEVNIEIWEIEYLLKLTNEYFGKQLFVNDILTSWSGLRPLIYEAGKSSSALSRDFALRYNAFPAPAVTIYGGKLTTYRQVALQVINQLHPLYPTLLPSISHQNPLPGACFEHLNYEAYINYAHEKYSWLEPEILNHYLQNYGTLTETILQSCHQSSDLGQCFGKILYQCEIDYLLQHEWAKTIDDILLRRTKLGLGESVIELESLKKYLTLNALPSELAASELVSSLSENRDRSPAYVSREEER